MNGAHRRNMWTSIFFVMFGVLLCLPAATADIVWLTLELEHGTVTLTPRSDGKVVREGSLMRVPFERGREVAMLVQAEGDWLFNYWSGDVDAGIDPHSPAVTVEMSRDRAPVANFIARPGLSQVDMLQDLADFLVAIGERQTIYSWDRNEVAYDENGDRVYVGNGIPDAAELYLLETVLKTRRLNLTPRGGVSHDSVWDMWAANLAQAEVDLPSQTPAVQRVVAGYMTIGTFESTSSIQDLAQTHFATTVDPLNYQRNSSEYLGGEENADRDSVPNFMEWQLASPEESLDDVDAFVDLALDGHSPPDLSAQQRTELRQVWKERQRARQQQ